MRARFRLEHGLLAGGAIAGAGALIAAVIVLTWIQRGFGVLAEERLLVAASALIIIGVQVLFSSFLLSILGLRRRDGATASPGARAETSTTPDQALRVDQADPELAPAVQQDLEVGG